MKTQVFSTPNLNPKEGKLDAWRSCPSRRQATAIRTWKPFLAFCPQARLLIPHPWQLNAWPHPIPRPLRKKDPSDWSNWNWVKNWKARTCRFKGRNTAEWIGVCVLVFSSSPPIAGCAPEELKSWRSQIDKFIQIQFAMFLQLWQKMSSVGQLWDPARGLVVKQFPNMTLVDIGLKPWGVIIPKDMAEGKEAIQK